MCQVLHIVDFLGSRQMETAPKLRLRPLRFFYVQLKKKLNLTQSDWQNQSDEPSDSRGSLSPTIVYTA